MKKYILFLVVIVVCCSSFQRRKKHHQPSIPAFVQALIKAYKAEAVQNPPRSIYSFTYKDKTVYYVPPICCDMFSDLYDSAGQVIAHPDGGFTGRGDGKLPDFATAKKNEKLIWKDERK